MRGENVQPPLRPIDFLAALLPLLLAAIALFPGDKSV
jgi:hypothetical protein